MAKKPKKRIRKKKERESGSEKKKLAKLEAQLAELQRTLATSRQELETASDRLADAEEQVEYSNKRAEIAEEFLEQSQQKLEEALELIDHTAARAEMAEKFAEECADAEGETLILRYQYEEMKSKYQSSRAELEHAKSSLTLVEEAAEEAEERAYFVEKELLEAEQRARELASGEQLTPCEGTFDKFLLSGALEVALKQAKRRKRKVALLNIRALRVKEMDGLEPLLAKRLSKVVRDSDLLAKIAPFTFAVLIAEEADENVRQIVKALVKRAESVFGRPMEFNGERFFPAVAVGVSVFPTDSSSSKDILRYAGVALSEAVERQAPGLHYYTTR